MKQTQRHDAIIELVKKQGYVSTEELVEQFAVSPQTIRRDLNDLAEQKMILRHHGGAALPSSSVNTSWHDRKATQTAEKERIASAQALLMQLESPLESVIAAAKIAHHHHTTVVLNPAPARELPDELLALVDIITPNETEAEKLTGIRVESDEDAAKAADVLHAKGIGTVMITLGSRGVWLSAEGESRRIPGFRVQAIDTIAAGDTFNGALVTALLEGTSLPEAIRFAHAAAAIAVTRKGAQPSVPWRTEIDEFLAQQG